MTCETTAPGASGHLNMAEPSLLRAGSLISGNWQGDGVGVPVINPATGLPVFTMAHCDTPAVTPAVNAGQAAMVHWQRLLPARRGGILRKWATLMRTHADDLARIITVEQGKPLAESFGEIEYGAGFLDWFASEGERFGAMTHPGHRPDMFTMNMMQPVGLSVAITPWNFPIAMIARKAGAALAAGCAMIVKPACETPLSANALAVLAQQAGVPPGVFQVIHGDPARMSTALMEHPDVRAVSFTGSTRVGRILLAQAARTVKRCSMELGGNAPFIVFADADLDLAVKGCMAAKFATSGQDCLAANRIYVHHSLHDAFVEKLAQRVAALRVGQGCDPRSEIGPMTVPGAVKKCRGLLQNATAQGAEIIAHSAPVPKEGYFVQPTLLCGVTDDMAIAREEIFAPLLGVLTFSDTHEVITRANATEMGLAAYVYTRSLARAQMVSQALAFGMVAVNTPGFTGPPLPFGGWKQSGLGREGGVTGIYEYLENKNVSYGGMSPSVMAAE